MAGGTIVLIKPRAQANRGGIALQSARPGHIIGVEIKNAMFDIGGLTTPFRAAVIAGKHHRLLADAQRRERATVMERAKLLQRPLMRLRRAVGEEALTQPLAGGLCGRRGHPLWRRRSL